MKTAFSPTYYLNYNEQKALDGIIQKISLLYPIINKIILYGSKARGDFTEESDVDILFIADSHVAKAVKFEIYDIIYEFQLKYDVVVSAIFIAYSDFQAAVKPLIRQVHMEGITLWSRE